jgi:hypothetical protein
MRFPLLAALAATWALGPASALDFNLAQGETGFGFLKYSLSPRSIALGGSGVALVDGVADADLNPAAAARDSGGLVLGQGYPRTFAATGSYAAWNIPWNGYRVMVQARYLGYDNISGWNELDRSTAGYGAHTLKLQAGTAGHAWGFAFGASLAYAQNNIADATYDAGLINLGLWRGLPFGLAAGVSLMNADLWSSTARDGGKVFLPATLQAGLAYSRALPGRVDVSVAVDARKRNDEPAAFPAGLEARWQNILSARMGYPFGEPEASPSFGLGLRWSRYGFDYEYQSNAVLAGAHFWALSIRY